MLHIDVTEFPPNTDRGGQTVHIRDQTLTFRDSSDFVQVAATQRGKKVQIGIWNEHTALATGKLIYAYEIRTYINIHHMWDRTRRLWTIKGKPAFLAWNPDETRFYGFTAPHAAAAREPFLEEVAAIENMLSIDPTPDRDQVDLVIGLRGTAQITWHPQNREDANT